ALPLPTRPSPDLGRALRPARPLRALRPARPARPLDTRNIDHRFVDGFRECLHLRRSEVDRVAGDGIRDIVVIRITRHYFTLIIFNLCSGRVYLSHVAPRYRLGETITRLGGDLTPR